MTLLYKFPLGISIWNQTLSLSADTELLVLESEGLDNCGNFISKFRSFE